jgi:hypothetical protein
VTGDGAPELYLVDHDSGFDGYGEPAAWDLEDRLLVNDGAGYFTDETALRMQSIMYVGGFGVGGRIGDYNLDGKGDVLRASTGSLSDPVQEVSLSYNGPGAEGTFGIYQEVYTLGPYAIASGDLNQDGRLDVVVGDDNQDRYVLNTGVDPLGRAIWSPSLLFDFLAEGDDGFTGQILVHDLDRDGFPEALIADEDVDIASTAGRRLHLYHTLGGAPGAYVTLREERQSSAASSWIGAEGLHDADLLRTYDMAALDIDGDGFDELVLGRVSGTTVWRNTTGERVCQPDLGFAGPGSARLDLCGQALAAGKSADLVVSHASPLAPGVLAYGFAETALPFAGGTLVVVPAGLLTLAADDGGKWVLPDVVSSGGPSSITLQAVLIDPSQPFGLAFTNAVRAELLP